jgi:hypothetical protein
MASRLIVPFDNNPSSTTLKTSSYTIPAGKYAVVKPFFTTAPRNIATNVQNFSLPSPYFATLNGVNVSYSSSFTTGTINISGGANTGTTSSAIGKLNVTASTAVSGQSVFYGSTSSTILYIGGPSSLSTTVVAGSNITVNLNANTFFSIYQYSSVEVNGDFQFWVKAGDVLSGTAGNFNWLVTEYNAIS